MFNFAEVKISYKPKIKMKDVQAITCSKDAFELVLPLYDQDSIAHIESFIVIFLNKANKPIGHKTLSVGGTAGTYVDIKVLFQHAILMNASGFIASHNHPSGNLKPSEADIVLTKRMKQAGELLDIKCLDHLIVSYEGEYRSFADHGEI